MSSIFGDIVSASDVSDAMEATIRMWIPDYLAEVADQHGRDRGALPNFKSYTTVAEFDLFPEEALPACVIVAPGTGDRPTKRVNYYDADWIVGVGGIVSGPTRASTLLLAQLYGAAIRTLVAHHSSLGGFASGTVWDGERYDEMTDVGAARTQASCTLQFTVYRDQVVDLAAGGPSTSSVDVTVPPDDRGVFETTAVALTVEEELT